MLALMQEQKPKVKDGDFVELEEIQTVADLQQLAATQDKNIGEIPKDGSTARFIGYLIIAFVVTFALLSMGMCALWCRRQYKKHFIEERRQRENYDEIVAGQVHHGMYKNENGDWEIVEPGDGAAAGENAQEH